MQQLDVNKQMKIYCRTLSELHEVRDHSMLQCLRMAKYVISIMRPESEIEALKAHSLAHGDLATSEILTCLPDCPLLGLGIKLLKE